ncbi:kelch-like protein 10 isoform X2 [Bacillus rossius redtenbacheri]|uniref:kelch-like protein 10 isoform X2 n=1 Tax=Bacillus rossius redtenbacheri TaxID=93214 RepID=UPI002FDE54D4
MPRLLPLSCGPGWWSPSVPLSLRRTVARTTVFGICISRWLLQPPRRKHQFTGLEREAWHHLTSRFPAVAQGSAQLAEMLSAEELAHLLSADQLNTPSELFVWQCALHWVQHRPAERARHLPVLLAAVRLHHMDRRAFFRQVAKNPLVVADSLCQPAVSAASEFFYRRNAGLARAVEPRLPHQVMFVVGGWTDQGPTTHVETYDTKANEWQQVLVEEEAGPKVYHATAVLGHCIYVIGGFGSDEYYSTCQSFHVVTKTWADLSPMNARRYYLASAVLGNDIYAIGGLDGVRRHRSVEKYNPYDNQWRFVASMNSKRSDAGATEFNGKIYVVGGFDGFECVKSAEVYDPDADQWTFIRPMISRRSGITCVVYHGYIYTAVFDSRWLQRLRVSQLLRAV